MLIIGRDAQHCASLRVWWSSVGADVAYIPWDEVTREQVCSKKAVIAFMPLRAETVQPELFAEPGIALVLVSNDLNESDLSRQFDSTQARVTVESTAARTPFYYEHRLRELTEKVA